MALLVVLVLGGGAVLLIAWMAVSTTTARLGAMAPQPFLEIDTAVDYVADRLPEEVAGRLSHDDVRRMLLWHVDYLESNDLTRQGEGGGPPRLTVVADDHTVDYVAERCRSGGITATRSDVESVLRVQNDHLRSIGVIGPRVSDPTDLE